jgi:transcriptional regulator with XRE-family HTH domain
MKEIVSLEQENRYVIADRIAGLREQAGYMSKEMAQKMDISASAYSDIECANTKLSVDNLYKICQIFKVSADYIIFGETDDAYMAEIRRLFGKLRPGMAEKIVDGLKVMFE